MAKITQQERARVAREYLAGGSPSEIGERYGLSCAAVIMIGIRHAKATGAVRVKLDRPSKPRAPRKRAYEAKPKREAMTNQKRNLPDPHAIGSGRRNASGYLRLM